MLATLLSEEEMPNNALLPLIKPQLADLLKPMPESVFWPLSRFFSQNGIFRPECVNCPPTFVDVSHAAATLRMPTAVHKETTHG